MNTLKTGIITTLAAGALVVLASACSAPGSASVKDAVRQSTASGSSAAPSAAGQPATGDVAGVACRPADGGWTDCTLTLNQTLGSGGSVSAVLPGQSGTVSFCDNNAPLSSLCGISGNAAVFTCPTGCGAGTGFAFSVLGVSSGSAGSLARQFRVTGSGRVGLLPRDTVLAPSAAGQ